jgi:HSP20 family protein
MPIIPYGSYRQFDQLKRDLDQLFHGGLAGGIGSFQPSFHVPRLDIHETETEVIVTCDIPGLEHKEDVDIDVDDQLLTISGKVERRQEIERGSVHRQERLAGHFQRTVSLPTKVSTDAIRGSYRNGVLEVRLSKSTRGTKQKVNVEFQ